MISAPGRFRGKNDIVTGGGTGIGRTTALLLARLGAGVVIASRKREHLDPTAQELIAVAGEDKVVSQVCDIRGRRHAGSCGRRSRIVVGDGWSARCAASH